MTSDRSKLVVRVISTEGTGLAPVKMTVVENPLPKVEPPSPVGKVYSVDEVDLAVSDYDMIRANAHMSSGIPKRYVGR
jgi:hypothetical protein